jgi:hypothetical protein
MLGKFTGKFKIVLLPVSFLFAIAGANAQSNGIWMSEEEINQLPVTGTPWNKLVDRAQNHTNNPDLANQNDTTDTNTVAKALVYARTGNTTYGDEVLYTLQRLIELNPTSRSSEWTILGTLRSLGSYAIAADLIDLKNYAPDFDKNKFRPWLDKARYAQTSSSPDGGGSVVSRQEIRPNNFGTHASASRIAASLYLQDQTDLNRAISVFKGWLGDRSAYTGFKYGDLSWQANRNSPVGINPKGSKIDGHNVDGVLPDDARRCGSFDGSFCKSGYMWEGLQGVVVAAEMLHRAGYPAFEWSDRAILRSMKWLHTTTFEDGKNYPAEGDDIWQVYIINNRYGTNFSTGSSSTTTPGKMMGFTEWTHSSNDAGDISNPGSGTDPGDGTDPGEVTDPEVPACEITHEELAIADSYVRGDTYRDDNFGGDDQLVVKGAGTDVYTRRAYLQFDLNSFASSSVDSAALTAYVDYHQNPGKAVPLKLFSVVSNNWEENAVTWSNQPGEATLLDVVNVTDVGTVKFDISDYVDSELAGDRKVSFVLLDDSGTNEMLRIRSREAGSQQPGLSLCGETTLPQPEPEPEPEPQPEPEPESSMLSLVSSKFWSSTGNLQITLQQASSGATIKVTDDSGSTIAFGRAPVDGSSFTLKESFYSGSGSCNYSVTDGSGEIDFKVQGSRRYGCGPR